MKYNKSEFKQKIISGCGKYGIPLDSAALDKFYLYYELLYNKSLETNLISKRDLSRFAEYHILDSLKIAPFVSFSKIGRVLDFGSGAGIPGIPLTIAFPHLETVLLDSRKLRCGFLESSVSLLKDLKLSAVCSKIENFSEQDNFSFDLIVTRATVTLDKFFILNKRFLKQGGSLISIKGNSISDEIDLLKKVPEMKVFNIETLVPPSVEGVRSGFVVKINHK